MYHILSYGGVETTAECVGIVGEAACEDCGAMVELCLLFVGCNIIEADCLQSELSN